MKKLVVLLVSLLAANSALCAPSKSPSSSYNIAADISYAEHYVFRGLGRANESLQFSVQANIENFYLRVWTNQPRADDQGGEVDYNIGWKYAFTEHLTVDAMINYYWYPDANKPETKNTYEGGLGAIYKIGGLSANAYAYYDCRLEAITVQGGLGYGIPFRVINFTGSVDLGGYAGTVNARNWTPDGNVWSRNGKYSTTEAYNYYGADLVGKLNLNERLTLHAGVHYATHEGIKWNDDKLWYSAGLTVRF